MFVDIELAGVPVDVDALEALAVSKSGEVVGAGRRLRETLGITNPNSQKQLLPALRRAGLDVEATNAGALAPYRDRPIVRDLAEMRTGKKVADDARALAEIARSHPDGRVRADWHQIGGTTGRMSTSKPNLLGLPKMAAMRACIASRPGYTLVVADFATIELRVLAHVTKDERLTKIFLDPKGDPHRTLAASMLGKPPGSVTPAERTRAKPVNFGLPFGMGPAKLVAYALEKYGVVLTETEAKKFKDAYLRAHPQVADWQRRTKARMDLEVRSCAGRVRAFQSREEGYTDRLNMPVQGTALDGMKEAMALVAARLKPFGARIILAIHDELVVETPEGVAQEVKAVVEAGMIEGMRRHVPTIPIAVEAEVRRTWGKP